MKVQLTGKGLEVGQFLRNHVEESLASHVKKYFDNAIDAKVVIYKESYKFHVDITVNEGVSHGIFIKASGFASHPYAAVDEAIIRVSSKLRRYKGKLKDYKKPTGVKAAQYMVTQDKEFEKEDKTPNDTHLITEEKSIQIQFLSVAEAVMHLELSGLPALMFINKSNTQLNMVYERRDGNIAWIEAPDALDKITQ